jgi:hypothetical protein
MGGNLVDETLFIRDEKGECQGEDSRVISLPTQNWAEAIKKIVACVSSMERVHVLLVGL